MNTRPENTTQDPQMDRANLYREEIFTDRHVGTIRRLTPVKPDGSPDTARQSIYLGEAQLLTNVGALPLSFEIEARSLEEAVANYASAVKQAFDRAMKELQELRREAASSIVIPDKGMGGFGPGGLPGGGKIQLR
jgi:rhamnose utilization protein RhaD (predicted bifunctional aldolase and dehydrogenase)